MVGVHWFPKTNFEVTPHYNGIQLWVDEYSVIDLNIQDAFVLQKELDTQVALASGLELLNLQAQQVKVGDILWHLGRLTVTEVVSDIEMSETKTLFISADSAELFLTPDTRLFVGRPIV